MKKVDHTLIGDKMLVSLRIRPFKIEELEIDKNNPYLIENNNLTISHEKNKRKHRIYNFDNILDTPQTQMDVYEKTSESIIESLFQGYTGTILCYGQTGTGKTYTMFGNLNNESEFNIDKGVAMRSFDQIFENIKKDKKNKYNVYMSYIRVYLETVYDLIQPNNTKIIIKDDVDLTGRVKIEGVQWIKVNSSKESLEVIQTGIENKLQSGIEDRNAHEIIIVRLEKTMLGKYNPTEMITKTSLFLVDMAGSEKVRKSNSENINRIKEYKKINYSFFILSKCFFDENKKYYDNDLITYKNTKLTRLLQDSFRGNSKTSLIITISSSVINLTETLNSLNFSQMAMTFKMQPILNLKKYINYKFLYEKVQEDLDDLNDEYTKLNKTYDEVDLENKNNKNTIFNLQKNESLLEIYKSHNSSTQNYIFDGELKIIEEIYEKKLEDLENENTMLLGEMDKLLLDREHNLEIALIENKSLKLEIEKFKIILEELKNENEELLKSFIDKISLTNCEKCYENNIINVDDNNNLDQNLNEENDFDTSNSNLKTLTNNNERNNNKNIEINYEDLLIQAENEIQDLQISELFKNLEKSLETVNFKGKNQLFKLQFYVARYEKEMNRLKTENKEVREKLNKYEDFPLDVVVKNKNNDKNNNDYYNDEDNLNISQNSTTVNPLSNKNNNIINSNIHNRLSISTSFKNTTSSLDKNFKDSFNFNNLVLSPQKVFSLEFSKSVKDFPMSLIPEFNLQIDNLEIHTFSPIKSLFKLDTEDKILELQTEILKLKTLILRKNKQIDEMKSTLESNKNIIFTKSRTKSISNSEDKLTFNYDLIKTKYDNKNKHMEDFKSFLNKNTEISEKVEQFFTILMNENKKNYLNDLFEKDMNISNLDLFNYKIFLHKVNNLNYKLKLEEQLDFNDFFYTTVSSNQSDNNFNIPYNYFIKKLLCIFDVLIKTLITENSKISYYSNNLNNLIKMNLEQKFDLLILEKKYQIQKDKYRKASFKSISNESQVENTNTASSIENNDDIYDFKQTYVEKENFTKTFDIILNEFDNRIIKINNDCLFNLKNK